MTVTSDVDAPPAAGDATASWLARYDEAVAGVLPRYFDIVAESASGCWITDVDGRRYLDLGAGIAVANVGHGHPEVVAAITAQAATLVHTSVVTRHRPYIELAEAIGGLTPFLERPRVFLCNSGAEAVDGAIKLARHVTGRPGIVAFRRAFHGRTLGATSLTTAKAKYREGYDPLLPSVHIAPYAIEHEGISAEAALGAFDELLHLQAAPGTIAAVIVEPVLGEGGYVPPPRAFLVGLRDRCAEHGMLLVFDEVQTGFGRTGQPFAATTYGVAPDVVLFAKGVAAGMPLGGIVGPAAIMDRWPQGAHGSTFGGNPVSCAAALASIRVLETEGLCANARAMGERAMTRLAAAAPGLGETVRDLRGIGLMIGLQLASGDLVGRVQAACLARGVIVLDCGPDGDVIRLVPPLTITADELDHGLDVLLAALAAAASPR